MGIFNFHYERPGPGVSPDAPRKKGAARFAEVVGRDFFSFYRAGALAFFSAFPFALGVWFSVTVHAVIPVLLAGFLGGLLAAPQLCALDDTILRSLRDEPGFWWPTYKRAWRQNLKASLLPGGLCGLVLGLQIFTLFHLASGAAVFNLVVLLLSFLLLCGLSQYLFVQIPLLELSLGGLLKNAMMLFLGFLPRTGLCLLGQAAYWGVVVLLWPISGFVVAAGTLWLPALLSIMAIYPPVEKSFGIEEKIKAMRDAKLAEGSDREQKPD